jgi:hypothetical protein
MQPVCQQICIEQHRCNALCGDSHCAAGCCCPQDLRLGNADRNGGNILVRRNSESGQWELIPIDHGYCLPSTFEDLSFEWMYW